MSAGRGTTDTCGGKRLPAPAESVAPAERSVPRHLRHDHETRTVENAARFEQHRGPDISVRVGGSRRDVWDAPGSDEL